MPAFHRSRATGNMRSRGNLLLLLLLLTGCVIGPAWGVQYRVLSNSSSSSSRSAGQLNVGDTLVSPSGRLELGIFRFGNGKFYLAIRYAAPIQQTPVWVANRHQPLAYDNSYLAFSAGNLQLFGWNQTNVTPVWASNTHNASVGSLMDLGNLVLDDGGGQVVWNSFNSSVTDTLLPGQYMYTGVAGQSSLTSWLSGDDPGPGNYVFGWGVAGLKNGTNVSNVLQLACVTCPTTNATGSVYIPAPDVDNPHIISDIDSIYFHPTLGGLYFSSSPTINSSLPPASTLILSDFQQTSNGTLRRLTLDTDGGLRIWEWEMGVSREWNPVANWVVSERGTQCFALGTCGTFGLCQMKPSGSLGRVQCTCPEGFYPTDPKDLSSGCVPTEILSGSDCGGNLTVMTELDGIDMPWGGDYGNSSGESSDAASCRDSCWSDCTCVGVVFSGDEHRCWRKTGTLYNLGYPTVALHGNDRVASIKISKYQPREGRKSRVWIVGPVLGGVVVVVVVFCIYRVRARIWGRGCVTSGPPDIPETPDFSGDSGRVPPLHL